MKKLNSILLLAFVNVMAFAQEKGAGTTDINVDINGGGETASSFPWLWIVGGIVLIVLLFALLGGSGGRDRIIERKTIVKE
ncbi:hypothetical protein [Desertivirga brevis]|uniref:hypothetical protein n=1 Tax=Desertivirga brevis TaxID=2810310 RepID=UPI001A96EF6E|nr:hypothetical protein [Pedobacter sp. SYSU D00873]